jgi:hypothetical protein
MIFDFERINSWEIRANHYKMLTVTCNKKQPCANTFFQAGLFDEKNRCFN